MPILMTSLECIIRTRREVILLMPWWRPIWKIWKRKALVKKKVYFLKSITACNFSMFYDFMWHSLMYSHEKNWLWSGFYVTGLTNDEILAQTLLFLLAGYDTTSKSLSFFLHCLALNQHEQEKVVNEISNEIGDEVVGRCIYYIYYCLKFPLSSIIVKCFYNKWNLINYLLWGCNVDWELLSIGSYLRQHAQAGIPGDVFLWVAEDVSANVSVGSALCGELYSWSSLCNFCLLFALLSFTMHLKNLIYFFFLMTFHWWYISP